MMNQQFDPRSYAGFRMASRMAAFSSGIRIGDTERNDAVQRLNEHYAAGRLTHLEHDERVDFAMNAKTQADLTVLFADLPHNFGASPEHHHRRVPFAGPLIGTLIMIAIVSLVLTAVITLIKALPIIFVVLLAFFVARRIGRRRWARRNYGGWGGHHNW